MKIFCSQYKKETHKRLLGVSFAGENSGEMNADKRRKRDSANEFPVNKI
jgi:hypothetical protein